MSSYLPHKNPLYSTTTTRLTEVLRGEVDIEEQAAHELLARGRDHNGNYVGNKAAQAVYDDFSASRNRRAA